MQVQRLREHIEKKHADLADADGGATANASADTKGGAESPAQQTLQAGSKVSWHCCHLSRFSSEVGSKTLPRYLAHAGQDNGRGCKGRVLHGEVPQGAAAGVVHTEEAALSPVQNHRR